MPHVLQIFSLVALANNKGEQRWYPLFSQTYLVNPEKERTRCFRNKRNGQGVDIRDYHRWNFHTDGGDEEHKWMYSLGALEGRGLNTPPEANDITQITALEKDSPNTQELSVDLDWEEDVKQVWAGNRGIRRWVTREPDNPGIGMTEETTLAHPPFQGFAEELQSEDFRLERCFGEDNFIVWFWLYRRATASDELKTPNTNSQYHDPCAVLVGSLRWRVSQDYRWFYRSDWEAAEVKEKESSLEEREPDSKEKENTSSSESTTLSFPVDFTNDPPSLTFKVDNQSVTSFHTSDRRNTKDKNWEYFRLFDTPEVHYDYPAETNLPNGLSFPDLRLDSAINKWTYWTLRAGSLNHHDEIVTPFTHKEMYDPQKTRIMWGTEQENEIFARRPNSSRNLLNRMLQYQPITLDEERKLREKRAKGKTGWESGTRTNASGSTRLDPGAATRRGGGFSFRNRGGITAGQGETVGMGEKKDKEETILERQ